MKRILCVAGILVFACLSGFSCDTSTNPAAYDAPEGVDTHVLNALSHIDTDGIAGHVRVNDGYAYVSDGANGVLVLDVSEPSTPSPVAQVPVEGDAVLSDIHSWSFLYHDPVSGDNIIQCNTFLMVTSGADGVTWIMNINDPGEYESSAEEYLVPDGGGAAVKDLCINYNSSVDRTCAYCAVENSDGGSRLSVWDIENFGSPKFLVEYESTPVINALDVEDDFAFLATQGKGLSVVNIVEGTNPAEVASITWYPVVLDIEVNRGLACLACGADGFVLAGVSDPLNPVVLKRILIGADVLDVYVIDQYAFLSLGDKGLVVLDIADPLHVQRVASVKGDYSALSSTMAGGVLYVAAGDDGVFTYELVPMP